MNLLPDLIGAIFLALFAILSIKTWDVWCTSRANRKSEAASLSKRQHDAALAQFANILREAALMRGKK